MSYPDTSALAAYWRFFEGTNSRDVQRLTDALNFPHVRISARGNANIVPDAQTHVGRVSFDALIATGWDHTVGMEPEILDVVPRKVHIKGGWTRFTRDDKPIISNMVTYIVTLVDGHWGVQSRFGTDTELFWGNPEDDPVDHDVDVERNAKKAEDVVASALEAMSVDHARATRHFHYPHLIIDPGDIESIADETALLNRLAASSPRVERVEAVQVGATGVNVSFRATFGNRPVAGICLVSIDGDRWGIKGSSLVVPEVIDTARLVA